MPCNQCRWQEFKRCPFWTWPSKLLNGQWVRNCFPSVLVLICLTASSRILYRRSGVQTILRLPSSVAINTDTLLTLQHQWMIYNVFSVWNSGTGKKCILVMTVCWNFIPVCIAKHQVHTRHLCKCVSADCYIPGRWQWDPILTKQSLIDGDIRSLQEWFQSLLVWHSIMVYYTV